MKHYLLFLLVFIGKIQAQDVDKTSMGGYGIQIGSGVMHGGLGVLGEYEKVFKNNLRISKTLGLGIQKGGVEKNPADYYWLGTALGIQIEKGSSRRFITGAQILMENNLVNKPKNALINKKILWGPSYMIGYKGMSSIGIMWQFTMGLSYLQDPYKSNKIFYMNPHIGIGVGYKFKEKSALLK